MIVPARLKPLLLIPLLSLLYVKMHWMGSDMALYFLPVDDSTQNSVAVKNNNRVDGSNVHEGNEPFHNESIHKGDPVEHQRQSANSQNNVSERVLINEEKAETRNSDISQSAKGDEPTAIDEEKTKNKENDRGAWESLWRHRISSLSDKTKDTSIEERQRLWQPLLDQPPNSNVTHQFAAISELFAAFPPPKDSISLYNTDAYNSLISSILQAHKEGRNFTIVASGGSATAGGGWISVRQEQRYYSKFAGYLNELLPSHQTSNPTVQWIGQGHGFRNSLHTAIFFDSFIPLDTDLLLWEFSINDAITSLNDDELIARSARENLLPWLYQVKRMKQPSKVILIYKWDAEFKVDEKTNRTICRAFDANGSLARQFDFVVGHIHMGNYINELGISECKIYESCPLLRDRCHVTEIGHAAIAFLLINFMNPNRLPSQPQAQDSFIGDSTTDYQWSCGNETEAKLVLKQVMTTMVNSSVEWRSPLGAWTLELPVVDGQVTPRRLEPGPAIGDRNYVGKQDPLRQDRQSTTSLYRCGVNESNSFSLVAPLEPMADVRVVLLTFRIRPVLNTKGIEFRLNGSNMTTNGELVPLQSTIRSSIMNDWRCSLPYPWGNSLDVYVYIFREPQPLVHSIELCTPKKFTRRPQVQSLAFW
mmetsp:Transcript_32939/g.79686  ORF Transcript_32939/g.79686 Transcript_32939/m.79686 type:complete len:647 (-) Transcript_32939:75-2015(-)